jgi:hypothetical protein
MASCLCPAVFKYPVGEGCLFFLILLYLAMTSRKRRAPASFEWNRVPDDADEDVPPQSNIRIRHTHHNLDHNGPSTRRTTYIHAPASPTKKPASSNDYNSYNWNDEPPPPEISIENYPFLDPAYRFFRDDNDMLEPQERRRKRTLDDDPLRKWIPDRDNYLQELLRLDGRAGLGGDCGLCHAKGPEYRCEDCFGGLMFCQGCMVDLHACMPLHRVEVRIFVVSYASRNINIGYLAVGRVIF